MNTSTDKDYQQKLIDRLSSKPGLRGKIDAKCVECIYDELDVGTWREQVARCSSYTCPLRPVRPQPTNK